MVVRDLVGIAPVEVDQPGSPNPGWSTSTGAMPTRSRTTMAGSHRAGPTACPSWTERSAGWFGPVDDHVLPMIGDLVVAATGRAGVVDSRTQATASLLLRGMHGSLTPGEMLVPLFVVA